MKKSTKLALIALLVCLFIVSTAVLAACGGKGALETYKPSVADKRVSDDFVLEKYIGEVNEKTQQGKYKLKWTSSNPNAIKLTEMENEWLAEVTLADNEQEVTLTAKTGGAKKDFKVRVAAFSASIFADNYKFPQSKATVFDDFDLDKTYTFKGKTANIEWEVRDDSYNSSNYIDVVTGSDGKQQCLVTPSGMQPTVQLHATFKYNNDEAEMPYRFNVYVELSDDDKIDYWYTNTGVSMDLEGYVVAIAENDTNYNNVTFYMADKSWNAGYYIFRGGADATCHEKLDIGAYVRVTGTTNTDYNGLFETNQGGTVIVDTDKSVSKDEVMKHVYAIDNDVIGDVPATLYHESQLVSLTGWTVKSVATPAGEKNSETLMTLTKDGKSINIQMSGYMKWHYKLGDDTWKAIVAHVKDQTGKLCTITGVLGKYGNDYQILAVDKDWIKFEEAPVEKNTTDLYLVMGEPTEGTNYKWLIDENGKYWFAKAEMSSTNYVAISNNVADAAVYAIEKSGEGYLIKANNQYLAYYQSTNADGSKTYNNLKFVSSATDPVDKGGVVWSWNATIKSFTCKVGAEGSQTELFLGVNYASGKTTFYRDAIGLSDIKYATQSGNFVARFGNDNPDYEEPVVHPAVKVNNASKVIHEVLAEKGVAKVDANGKLTGNYIVPVNTSFDLPATSEGVAVVYKLCWENAYVTYKTVGDTTSFTVAPGAIHEKVKVRVEYEYKEGDKVVYTTYEYFTIETHLVTSQVIADEEAREVMLPKELEQGQKLQLDLIGSLYGFVTFDWTYSKEAGADVNGDITFKDGLLTIGPNAKGGHTITMSLVVKHGSYSREAKEYVISIPALDPNVIKLSPESMGLASGSYAKGETVVNSVKFAYNEVGNYGSGLQFRASNGGSSIATAEGIGANRVITKIELTYNHEAGQTSVMEGLTISFDANNQFKKEVKKLTFEAVDKGAANKKYTITPEGKWNYVEIKYTAAQYSQYWASIIIYVAEGTPDAGSAPEGGTGGGSGEQPTTPSLGVDTGTAAVVATFNMGTDGTGPHSDGGVTNGGRTYAWNDTTDGQYTLENNSYSITFTNHTQMWPNAMDEIGNGCMKLGTGSATAGFSFTVANDVKYVVIYVAGYKGNDGKVKINNTEFEVKTHSNDGAYTAIAIDVTTSHSIELATLTGTTRCMIDKIEFLK